MSIIWNSTDPILADEPKMTFSNHFRRIRDGADSSKMVRERHLGLVGEYRIGAVPDYGHSLLLPRFSKVNQKYPGVKLSIVYAYSPDLEELLLSGKLNAAVVANLVERHRFETFEV